MTTVFVDISAALDKHLNDLSGKPPVAWENDATEDAHVPTIGELYLRPTNLQGDTFAETEQDRTDGVYQIDIVAPSGKGKAEANTMADILADRFKQDAEIIYTSAKVTSKMVSKRDGVNDDDGWFIVIVEIVYYAYTARR